MTEKLNEKSKDFFGDEIVLGECDLSCGMDTPNCPRKAARAS